MQSMKSTLAGGSLAQCWKLWSCHAPCPTPDGNVNALSDVTGTKDLGVGLVRVI